MDLSRIWSKLKRCSSCWTVRRIGGVLRNIQKSKEPSTLTTFRQKSVPRARYADLDRKTKDDIAGSILKEQGYICCYCMGRVGFENLRIEHWHCQSKYPDEQLDYQNLLASCAGNEGGGQAHCDVHKGDSDISYNPADPGVDVEAKLSYLWDGTITSDDKKFSRDINSTLRLNSFRLKADRSGTIRAVKKVLGKRPGSRTRTQIQKLIRRWESGDAQGKLKPYSGAALYWLRKRMKRAN